jgi:hypothetical protein
MADATTQTEVAATPIAAALATATMLILFDVAQNLVRRNALKHRPAIGVELAVICVPVAQIARILVVVEVVVGRRIHGLRRSNTRRRQHHGSCKESGELASHIVLHCNSFAAPLEERTDQSICVRLTGKCAG